MDPLSELFQKDYAHILAMARARLARERSPISTLTLVHELYLNLNQRDDLRFSTREQFFAYASQAMRSLLIDMARERIAKKRSAELLPLTFGQHVPSSAGTPEQFLALEDALQRLGKIDERLVRIAEMRLILGMEMGDIAAAIGMSEPTIKRDWRRIKLFLQDILGSGP